MRRIALVVMCLVVGMVAESRAQRRDEPRRDREPTVEIRSMKFEPAEIRIKSGQQVVWINRDDRDHTVTANNPKTLRSGNIKHGRSFTFTFPKAGRYPYTCSYHPRMKGVVVVE